MLCGFGCVGLVSLGPDRGAETSWAWDALSIMGVLRNAGSGPRCCCNSHAPLRKPHLMGSLEF